MTSGNEKRTIWKKVIGYFLAIAMVFTMTPLASGGVSYAEPNLSIQTPELVVTGTGVLGGDSYSKSNVGYEKSYTRSELKSLQGGTDVFYSAIKTQSPYTKQLYRASGVYLESVLAGTAFDSSKDKLTIDSNDGYTVTMDPAAEYNNGSTNTIGIANERYAFPGLLDGSDEGAEEVPTMLAWAYSYNTSGDPETSGSEKKYLTLIAGQLAFDDMNNSLAEKNVTYITAGSALDEVVLTVGDTSYTRADVLMMPFAENSYTYTSNSGEKTDSVRGVPLSTILGGYDDDDTVTFATADNYDMSSYTKTVKQLVDNNYMLAYEVNGTAVYVSNKNDDSQYGFLTLYGDNDKPAKMTNKVAISKESGIDFSKSEYKHITNGGHAGDDGPYNIDSITSATLTVEGPGTVASVPLPVKNMEGYNAGCFRGVYKDTRNGTETSRTYEGIDLYYLLHNMQTGTFGIKLTDKANKVLIKNRNRKTIATLTLAQIEQMHNDGDPALIAYGTANADGSNARPFVFDGGAGLDDELGNGDGCLKFVYDMSGYPDAYGANQDYTTFGNMAYVYVEEENAPGYKHDKAPYDTPENKNYVISITGDEFGKEINYTVDEIESLVEYNEDGSIKENGYGYKDEYSLTNTTYWQVNEYEGVKLWGLLQRAGVPASAASDDKTVVSFRTTDNYTATDSFTLKEIADPDVFGYYEKNALDNNDGTYEPNENIRQGDDVTTGDKLRVGYPVLLAYGVNQYPYVKTSKSDGYLSGLSNDGGPVRVIFGKKKYYHNNGSNQAKYVDRIIIGDNNYHYSTHAYRPNDESGAAAEAYKATKDLELQVKVQVGEGETANVLKEKTYKVSDIEDFIYGNKLTINQLEKAKVKNFYEAGSKGYSDLYEGINLIYFLKNIVELNGSQGMVTFTSSTGDTFQISLEKLLETTDGYNKATGMSGLAPVLAYAKNGAPMVNKSDTARGKDGYVSSYTLAEGTDFENKVDVKNAGGPLEVIFPREDKDATATMGSLEDVVSIEINLEADKYAHVEEPYSALKDNTITVTGPGTRLTEPKEFTVEDLEGKQPVIVTKDYSILQSEGSTAKETRYRGLKLYDFLKSSDVGLKSNASEIVITCSDGESATFTLGEIMKNDYVNSITGANDLPVMLAFGSASVTNEDIKDGKPLVVGKDSEGYDKNYSNNGGPIKLMVGQKDNETANGSFCLKDVVNINVKAAEQTSWNHSSAEIFKQYLDEVVKLTVIDENDQEILSKDLTVADIEANTDLVFRADITLKNPNTWEGIALWPLILKEAGTIEGINNPTTVTGISKDGATVELVSKIGIDQLEKGVEDGDGNLVPVLLGYAIDGYPLVPGGKNDQPGEETGYDPLVGNKGGPFRIVYPFAQGASITEIKTIEIKVGAGGQPIDENGGFNVQGVDNGKFTVDDLKKLEGAGAEKEYTCKKSTDQVRGILLKDVLSSLNITDEDAIFTINACGYENSEESYRDITLKDAIDQNYFVAYEAYNNETGEWEAIADENKDDPTFTADVRLYRNYNEALGNEPTLDSRNKCTGISGITVTIPEKTEFKVYEGTGEEGALPLSGFRATSMDMNGNLWIGTYGGGLCEKPVGQESFNRYNKASEPALLSTTVSAVAADNEGGVWFAQNGSYTDASTNLGLGYMKKGEIKYYTSADSPQTIPDNYVQDIKIDQSGNVWIATFGGVTKYDPDDGSWMTLTKEDGLPAESASRIEIASDGVWVGCYPDSEAADGSKPYTGGFAFIQGDKVVNTYTTEAPEDTSSGETLYRLGDVWVRDIAVDKNGGTWIVASGSYGGMNNVGGTLWYVSAPGADPVKYTGFDLVGQKYLSGASNSEIRMVEFDPDGGLWFGTSGDGLIYIKDPTVKDGKLTVTAQYNGANKSWPAKSVFDNVYSLDFYGKTIYVGTSGGMLTYDFDFENSAGATNPVEGDPAAAEFAITGAGSAKDAYFTIKDLKNASGIEKLTKTYSWLNKAETTGTTEFEGAYLENILKDVVGLKDNAKALKVVSTDGKVTEFTLEQAEATDLEGNKLMLAWKEDGAKINLKVVSGQYTEGEVNKSKWIKDVSKIIVLAEPAETVKAKDVIAAINEIGDVTLDSYDAITKARTLYDRLEESSQAKVSNYETLVEAEATYEALRKDAVIEVGQKLLDDIDYKDYDTREMLYLWIMSQKLESQLKNAESSDEAEAIVQEIQKTIAETKTSEQKAADTLVAPKLSKTSATYNKIAVKWNAFDAAKSYEVYRADKGSTDFKLIKTTEAGTTSISDTTVKINKAYDYKVRAVGTVKGEPVYGEDSNVLTVTAKLPAPKFKTPKRYKKKITVKWAKVSGASGYVIYRATKADGKYKKIKTIKKGSTVKYVNKKLKRHKKYYYKIRAYRTVNGVKYYGDTSKYKTIKTK